jgi:hypothetical protein
VSASDTAATCYVVAWHWLTDPAWSAPSQVVSVPPSLAAHAQRYAALRIAWRWLGGSDQAESVVVDSMTEVDPATLTPRASEENNDARIKTVRRKSKSNIET